MAHDKTHGSHFFLATESLREVNPEALLADGFESALIGYTVNQHQKAVAVYDIDKCADLLRVRDGGSFEDVDEFLCQNTLSVFVGECGPLFVKVFGGVA